MMKKRVIDGRCGCGGIVMTEVLITSTHQFQTYTYIVAYTAARPAYEAVSDDVDLDATLHCTGYPQLKQLHPDIVLKIYRES